MAFTKVNQKVAQLTGAGSTTSIPTTFNGTPTAGNLLIVAVSIRGAATSFTWSTPSGWTRLDTDTGMVSISNFEVSTAVFGKIAAGGDSAPTVTGTANIGQSWTAEYLTEERSGVNAASFFDAASTTSYHGQASGTSNVATPTGVTTTNANDYLWSLVISLPSSSSATHTTTWGGSFTQDTVPPAGTVTFGTGTRTVSATGTYTPTLTETTSGGTMTGVGVATFAFKADPAVRFVSAGMSVPGTSETSGPYERGDSYSFASSGTVSKVFFIIQAAAGGAGGPSVGDTYTIRQCDASGTVLNSTTWSADGTAGEKSVSVSWPVSAGTTYQFTVQNTGNQGATEFREPRTTSDPLQGTTSNGITRVSGGGIQRNPAFVSGASTTDWYTDVLFTPGAGGTDGTVTAVKATSTSAAVAPALSADSTVTAVAASASSLARNPVVGVAVAVAAVVATATSSGVAPTVQSGVNVTAVRGQSSSAAVAPTVQWSQTVTAVAGSASSAAPAPIVGAGANVTAVTGSSSSAAVAPALSAGWTVTAVRGTASSLAVAPGLVAGATVVAVKGTATSGAVAPAVGAGTFVQATAATGSSSALSPTIQAGSTVSPTPAVSTAAGVAPAVSGVAVDYALNKTATSSSVESVDLGPQYAVDGDEATRWGSLEGSDPQWIMVDLGQQIAVSAVRLNWEAASAKAYTIDVSVDGVSGWTTIYSTTTGPGGTENLSGLSGTGRFIRMLGTQRNTPWGYSLYSFNVYGTPVVADGSVTAPAATSASAAPAPAVQAGSTVAAVRGTATSAAVPPAVTGGAGVAAVKATAASAAVPPAVSSTGSATVSPPPGTATAVGIAPTLRVDQVVTAVAGSASSQARPPAVAAGTDTVSVNLVVRSYAQATSRALPPVKVGQRTFQYTPPTRREHHAFEPRSRLRYMTTHCASTWKDASGWHYSFDPRIGEVEAADIYVGDRPVEVDAVTATDLLASGFVTLAANKSEADQLRAAGAGLLEQL